MNEVENPMLDSAKKKKRIFVGCIVTLCVLYVICAVRPLSREIHFVPIWTIDADKSTRTDRIAETENDKIKFDDAIPFKMGQLAGYFTKNGKIISRVTFPYKATISQAFYALYETHSDKIPVYSPAGEKISEIKHTGFPYFDGDKIFLFLPGGASFAKIGAEGQLLWSYDGHSPITAFSSSINGILAGFADGELISFDADGNILFRFEPSGSSFPVIIGAGISNSGNLIATISGRDKQRIVLAKKENDRASVIFHKYFDKEVNNQMTVKFNKNETAVYYGCAGGLGVLDCKTFKNSIIPISGIILSIQEDTDGTVFVLSKDSDAYSVSVIEAFDVFSGSFSFEASTAFMSVKNGSLFVGHDSKISRIDIQHK